MNSGGVRAFPPDRRKQKAATSAFRLRKSTKPQPAKTESCVVKTRENGNYRTTTMRTTSDEATHPRVRSPALQPRMGMPTRSSRHRAAALRHRERDAKSQEGRRRLAGGAGRLGVDRPVPHLLLSSRLAQPEAAWRRACDPAPSPRVLPNALGHLDRRQRGRSEGCGQGSPPTRKRGRGRAPNARSRSRTTHCPRAVVRPPPPDRGGGRPCVPDGRLRSSTSSLLPPARGRRGRQSPSQLPAVRTAAAAAPSSARTPSNPLSPQSWCRPY
jgi:hypothetical protein